MADSVQNPAVTVGIVTYNSAPVLSDALLALGPALEGVAGYEIVVADNASDDETLTVVTATAPHARVVQLGANRGYAAGINAIVNAANATRAVLVLNPDARLRPGAVSRLLAGLDEPGVGIAVPKVLDSDGQLDVTLRREPSVLRALGEAVAGGHRAGRVPAFGEVIVDRRVYDEPATVDWAVGAVMLVSRSCLDVVGPWDESFFLYSEETDYCLRARDRGFTVRFVPEAVAVHLRGEAPASPRLWSLLTVNRWRLFRSRHGRLSSQVFWLVLLGNEVIRAPRRATHRAATIALLRRGRGAVERAAIKVV